MGLKSIEATLAERATTYGSYDKVSRTSQQLKAYLRDRDSWSELTFAQRESLDMICNKLARIVNGDPNYADSWHDIAGYASLVVTDLERLSGNAPEIPVHS